MKRNKEKIMQLAEMVVREEITFDKVFAFPFNKNLCNFIAFDNPKFLSSVDRFCEVFQTDKTEVVADIIASAVVVAGAMKMSGINIAPPCVLDGNSECYQNGDKCFTAGIVWNDTDCDYTFNTFTINGNYFADGTGYVYDTEYILKNLDDYLTFNEDYRNGFAEVSILNTVYRVPCKDIVSMDFMDKLDTYQRLYNPPLSIYENDDVVVDDTLLNLDIFEKEYREEKDLQISETMIALRPIIQKAIDTVMDKWKQEIRDTVNQHKGYFQACWIKEVSHIYTKMVLRELGFSDFNEMYISNRKEGTFYNAIYTLTQKRLQTECLEAEAKINHHTIDEVDLSER